MLGAAPIADAPPTRIRTFHGPADTVRTMIELCLGPRGEQSTLVRSMKDHIVRDLQPKDYLSELIAVRNFCAEKVRYSNDAVGVEQVQDPERMCEQIVQHGRAVGDCFEQGTLLLAQGHRLVPIEELTAGTKIWGYRDWSTVEAVYYKGLLPIDSVNLNNGSSLRLTADHHMYVLECPKHELDEEHPCSCPLDELREVRVRVSELRPGMVLTMPERLPFGQEDGDPDRAYVEGLYVSDGWSDQNSRFCISGQDGCAKEEQKHEVKRIADAAGIHTRWHRKYIAINDTDWALRVQQMGHPARNKRLLSLDLSEGIAAPTLRGVMADSGKNTCGEGRTFTTTSKRLAIQMRVLHKMFGISCGARYIENHGGLGQHPIWRLQTRSKPASGRREKALRVKSVDREVALSPVWDIQTSDHRVYLPEHDVTVSNCDDGALLIACFCRQLGRQSRFIIAGFGAPGSYSHVFAAAREPKSGMWLILDPVAGTDEASMMKRITTHQIWDIP